MTVLAAEKLRRAALWRNAWDARAIVAEAAADLLDAIDAAVEELRSEHLPLWANPDAEAKGKGPIGCHTCFPHDGSWPCVSRMIADEMHHLLHPEDGDA